jgi:4-hydroxy-2-oxoheptanedioate aldolase
VSAPAAEGFASVRDLKPNPIIAAWESGRPAISAWSVIPGKVAGEVLALLDFDAVAIDMQHSMFDRDDVTTAITAIQAAGSAAIVRIPWNDDPGLVMGLVDFGLAAIICPSVGSPEECQRFVSACRYPPLGIRNSNLTRASGYRRNVEAYFGVAHRRELVAAMVETVAGLDCIDEIAATPGLDVIQLGPSDLLLSRFGFSPPAKEGAEYIEAAHRLAIEVARRHKIRAAANAPNPERAKQLVGLGYDLIYLGCDLFDMQDHYRGALSQLGDVFACDGDATSAA